MADPATVTETKLKPAPDLSHCWDPVLDSGGTIPICIPLDSNPSAKPFRLIQVTREEQMFVHFKCCACSARATRRWKIQRDHEEHGAHHHVFTYPEIESLPEGPCPGAQG